MIKPIRKPRWEDLNAFVDGALNPARQLEIERAAMAEPQVAAEIEHLRAIKGALRESLADAPPPVPDAPRAPMLPQWASAAAVLLIAAALTVFLLPISEPQQSWMQRAESEYREWLETPADAHHPTILPASLDGTAGTFDLALAGLTLVEAHQASDGHYLGWIGSRGCRLGLWLADAPEGSEEPLTRHDSQGLLRAVWRSGGTAYALMAKDMDPRRFSSVARILENRTRADSTVVADSGENLTLHCLT